MNNSRGFIVYDTILAMNLVMTIALVIVPLYLIVQQEKQVLEDRTLITNQLYNDLQRYIRLQDTSFPVHEVKQMNHRSVILTFHKQDNFIEGCANWDNIRKRKETYCLYGIEEI